MADLRACPSCGGVMEKQTGTIEEPVMKTGSTDRIARRARPATYWACTACEHCEEK